MTITSIKIANAMVEQLRAELAAAQATIEQMREALKVITRRANCLDVLEIARTANEALALTIASNLDALHEALATKECERLAAPVVQPDMVMVPREPTEAMLDAAMNRYHHVSPEAKARYTQMHRENFRWDYRAMIAAAEGK